MQMVYLSDSYSIIPGITEELPSPSISLAQTHSTPSTHMHIASRSRLIHVKRIARSIHSGQNVVQHSMLQSVEESQTSLLARVVGFVLPPPSR